MKNANGLTGTDFTAGNIEAGNIETEKDYVLILPEWELKLCFIVEPEIEQPFVLMDISISNQTQTRSYRSGDYLLTTINQESPQKNIIDFSLRRLDNQTFKTINYCVKCIVPVVDFYNSSPLFVGYAHVRHYNPETFLASCTSKDSPYVMYGSRSGENRFTIGLENQYIETNVTRTGTAGYMYYARNTIKFERPVSGVTLNQKEVRDCIYLSTEKDNWFNVTRRYWDFIDKKREYKPNYTPKSAYGPLWCSWFYLTDINEEKIWANALKAKELGIKTLMIDAGWFCEDNDIPFADSPPTNKTIGFGRIDADGSKFHNMKQLVKRIHDLGLYVWAWCTPRWIFKAIEQGEGKVDQKLLDCRIVGEDGIPNSLLCTRHPGTREHAAKFTSYLLKEYNFDGLKFDCWEMDGDMDVCHSNHEHDCDTMGEGTLKWGKAIYDAMTKVNKEAVVWLSNTAMKPYSNYSCSPNEVYCQPDENWRMSVLLKTFTKGIVSQLCEGSWNPAEPDKELARQMAILMMGHVPEVQVDLTNLTHNHEVIVKNHFAFYKQHRNALLYGEYTPFGFEHMLGGPLSTTPPHVKIEGEDKTFLYIGPVICDNVEVTNNPKSLFIFNLKNLDGIHLDVHGVSCGAKLITEYDCYMNIVSQNEIVSDGVLYLDSNAGYGCLLAIVDVY